MKKPGARPTGVKARRRPLRSPQRPPQRPMRPEVPGSAAVPASAEVRGEKLHKMLAQAGLGSRRAMEERIRAGDVTVNGKVASIGDRVSAEDRVKVGERVVRWPQASPTNWPDPGVRFA